MKANEAPEKIYIFDNPILDFTRLSIRQSSDDIEYTRTDAFIEKAENFIYSALNDGIMGTCNIEDFIRLFKKYIKGE